MSEVNATYSKLDSSFQPLRRSTSASTFENFNIEYFSGDNFRQQLSSQISSSAPEINSVFANDLFCRSNRFYSNTLLSSKKVPTSTPNTNETLFTDKKLECFSNSTDNFQQPLLKEGFLLDTLSYSERNDFLNIDNSEENDTLPRSGSDKVTLSTPNTNYSFFTDEKLNSFSTSTDNFQQTLLQDGFLLDALSYNESNALLSSGNADETDALPRNGRNFFSIAIANETDALLRNRSNLFSIDNAAETDALPRSGSDLFNIDIGNETEALASSEIDLFSINFANKIDALDLRRSYSSSTDTAIKIRSRSSSSTETTDSESTDTADESDMFQN